MDLPVSASYWDEETAEEEASVSDADDVVPPAEMSVCSQTGSLLARAH